MDCWKDYQEDIETHEPAVLYWSITQESIRLLGLTRDSKDNAQEIVPGIPAVSF